MTTFSTPYVTALQSFYNTIGKSYNAATKSVHAGGPERLVEAAGPAITQGSYVLDLATGTGKVAFAAASQVGPTGRILGVDISDEFVSLAAQTAAASGVSPFVEFLHGDVGTLDLPPTYKGRVFDAATCGSAIAMFPAPGALLDVLARDMLKPGGVFVADMWGPHLPAKIFLDVAVPRGFQAPFDPRWLADPEGTFRRTFEGSGLELKSVRKEGMPQARWEAGTDEAIEGLWRNLAVEQTWLSFGLDGLDEQRVADIKRACVEELEQYKSEDGAVVADMNQWIAVAVVKD
ncbi:hypothetical protein N0V90_008924 [Kalmusia sp. IMI 367209]|nr:hypothetical protein N0V90_008924 [Kalmusia sp. IMI 367209]